MPTPLEHFTEAIELAIAQLDEADCWLEQIEDEPEAQEARRAVPKARRALEVVRGKGLRNTVRERKAA